MAKKRELTELSGRAERLISLIQLFLSSRKALSPVELASKYGISLRSMERYLEVLRDRFSFPIIEERYDRKRFYKLNISSFTFGSGPLSAEECEALYLSSQLVKLLPGTHFIPAMQKLFGRIESAVPEEFRAGLASGIRVHTWPVTDFNEFKEVIATVTKAVRLQKKILLVYTSKSGGEKVKQYVLSPYSLFFHPDGLYLVGQKDNESGLRVWSAHRMSTAKIINEAAYRDPSFDFEKRFELSLGAFQGGAGEEVTLRITGVAFKAFRTMSLPPIVKKSFVSKGIMELTLKVTGLEALKKLVLSYAEDVEVISPATFRKEIIRSLKVGLKRYE